MYATMPSLFLFMMLTTINQKVIVMITIQIGTSERRDGGIDKRWIKDQVNSRKKNGELVCVRLHIQCGDVNLRLKSRDCPKSKGGSRSLKTKEEHIVDEWTPKRISK